MKTILTFGFLVVLFCMKNVPGIAQGVQNEPGNPESTDITVLDYHLTKTEFLYYYGNDDTARAIINMFYR